ncbi:MAG: DUF2247 family protein [Lachnospiraceae bacterium]|nr:DUF2247 family protein [Lachnospiraceae bacterium]
MYGISIFDKTKIQLDWAIIYYGINNDILSIDIAQEFACRKLEHDEQMVEEELELSWSSNERLDVLELLERILDIQGNVEESLKNAKDKIRIAIIIYLRETEKDIVKLLEQMDMIYADFGYPVDMEKFISYMPIDENYIPSQSTIKERRNYLISKLDNFINEQLEKYQLKE